MTTSGQIEQDQRVAREHADNRRADRNRRHLSHAELPGCLSAPRPPRVRYASQSVQEYGGRRSRACDAEIPRQATRVLGAARGRRVVGGDAAHLRRAGRHHLGAGRHGRHRPVDRGRAGPARPGPPDPRAVRRVALARRAPGFRHVAHVRAAGGGPGGGAGGQHPAAGRGRTRAGAAGGRAPRRRVGQPARDRAGRDPRRVSRGRLDADACQFARPGAGGGAHRMAPDRRHDVGRRGRGARLAGGGRRHRPAHDPADAGHRPAAWRHDRAAPVAGDRRDDGASGLSPPPPREACRRAGCCGATC